MKELDRVFDGDDVLVRLAVDLVDHGGEGGRFAGTGRSRDEDEAARLVADLLDDRREAELLETEDFVGDLAVNGGDGAALIEDVRPETGQSLDAEREVELEVLFEAVLLRVGEHR